jgi:glycosyltransferase involved in cell wall biosynthesis
MQRHVAKRLTVSVVVPVYNEAAILTQSMAVLLQWLRELPWSWQLILVDDGSNDASPKLLRELAKNQQRVNVLGEGCHRGRGHALRTGVLAAQGSTILTTEADGSWDTRCLRSLVEAIEDQHADLAIASPFLPGGSHHSVPATRIMLSRVSNRVASMFLGHGLTMLTGMTRAYRREVISDILSDRDGKEFHLDTLCRALQRGLKILEVPARVTWRGRRSHHGYPGGVVGLASDVVRHLEILFFYRLRFFDPDRG